MSDLLKTIRAIFPPVLSGHLAARLGASVHGMQRAMQGAVPVMLGGLTAVAIENAGLIYDLCQQVQPTQPGVTGVLVMLGSKDAADSALIQGDRLLKVAFGRSEQRIIHDLSQFARLQPALVRSLLELVGASLLGALSQHATQHNLTAEGTAAVLVGLKRQVKALFPHELEGLVDTIGLRSPSRWKANPTTATYTAARQAAAQPMQMQWYLVAMVVLLMTGIGLAAFGALRPMHNAQQAVQTPAAQTVQIITKVAEDDAPSDHSDF